MRNKIQLIYCEWYQAAMCEDISPLTSYFPVLLVLEFFSFQLCGS